MTNKEFYELKEKLEEKMQDELLRVLNEGEEKDLIYVSGSKIDLFSCPFWFQFETFTGNRIQQHCCACYKIEELKEAIRWLLSDTIFTEVTSFVRYGNCFTFRNLETFDRDFYYNYKV